MIVRSSPGVAVLPVIASIPISTARPTFPLVEYQYRISSGITWIIEIRGSLASPLWTPSCKSPNHADVLKNKRSDHTEQNLGKNTDLDDKQSLMVSRSRLTLAFPERLVNFNKKPSVNTLRVSHCRDIRGPTSCLDVQEADIDVRVIFKFFKFMRHVISDEGQGQWTIFSSFLS